MQPNRRLIFVTVLTLLGISFVALADSRGYTPPAQTGYIYTVINYKRTALKTETTSISVRWGGYNKSDSVRPPQILPGRALSAKGFILRLRHTKNDAVPLTVETNGRIIHGPYQGDPPSQWDDSDYYQVKW